MRIDWATLAYFPAVFVSIKKITMIIKIKLKQRKSAFLLCGTEGISGVKLDLFSSCEPAFLSKDMKLHASETTHSCSQDWNCLSSRIPVKNILRKDNQQNVLSGELHLLIWVSNRLFFPQLERVASILNDEKKKLEPSSVW